MEEPKTLLVDPPLLHLARQIWVTLACGPRKARKHAFVIGISLTDHSSNFWLLAEGPTFNIDAGCTSAAFIFQLEGGALGGNLTVLSHLCNAYVGRTVVAFLAPL